MGGIPCNYHGEVVSGAAGDPDTVVPGLMAVGEAACVSVHGANRLGSNSLLDLVVFGREAARHCASILVKAGTPQRPLRAGRSRTRARATRPPAQCNGRAAHGADPRLEMQKTMQRDAAVFRTAESLAEGVAQSGAHVRAFRRREGRATAA